MAKSFEEAVKEQNKKNIPDEVDLNQFYRNFLRGADEGRLRGNVRDTILDKEGMSNAELAFLDPQVSACFLIKAFSVMNKKMTFKVPENITKRRDVKKSQNIADFLNFSLKKLKGANTQLRFDLLTSSFFGCSFVERVYDTMKTGKWKNFYIYSRTKAKRPGLWDFHYDKNGNVDGYISLIERKTVFPLSQIMSMSWLPLWNNPNGTPDFAKVRKFVKSKAEYIVFLLALGSRQAKGKQSILRGDGSISDGNTTEHKEVLDKLNDYLSLYLPKSYEVDFHKFDTSILKDFLDVLRWLDTQIAIAMLSNSMTTNENQKTGSHAMAKAQIDTGTFSFTEYACTTLIELFEEYYARYLILLNFDENEYPEEIWPVCELKDPETIDLKAQAELDEILEKIGILDLSTEIDLQNRRSVYGLPDNPELFFKNEGNIIDFQKFINRVKELETEKGLDSSFSSTLEKEFGADQANQDESITYDNQDTPNEEAA